MMLAVDEASRCRARTLPVTCYLMQSGCRTDTPIPRIRAEFAACYCRELACSGARPNRCQLCSKVFPGRAA